MVSGVKVDKTKIIKAIHQKRGIIKHAALIVPCDPVTIYDHMKNDPEVAQAVIEARANAAKDDIDHNELLRAKARVSTETLLDKCDVTTTIFIMKTLGGLVESQKDATVNVNIMKYTNE